MTSESCERQDGSWFAAVAGMHIGRTYKHATTEGGSNIRRVWGMLSPIKEVKNFSLK